MLVDGMDDAVNKAYAAWPERLYVVGLDGRLVFAGEMGPMGFSVEACEKALAAYLEGLKKP